MTPQYRRTQHDPDNGQWGDCARCCVAALLDLPYEEVPHFADGGVDAAEFDRRIQAFLRPLGLYQVGFGWAGVTPQEAGRLMKESNPGLFYMMGVQSPIAEHLIVCWEDEIVCDPSQHEAGWGAFAPLAGNVVGIYVLATLQTVMTQAND